MLIICWEKKIGGCANYSGFRWHCHIYYVQKTVPYTVCIIRFKCKNEINQVLYICLLNIYLRWSFNWCRGFIGFDVFGLPTVITYRMNNITSYNTNIQYFKHLQPPKYCNLPRTMRTRINLTTGQKVELLGWLVL